MLLLKTAKNVFPLFITTYTLKSIWEFAESWTASRVEHYLGVVQMLYLWYIFLQSYYVMLYCIFPVVLISRFFFSFIVKTMLTCTGTHTNKNARTHTQVMEYVEEHKSCYASELQTHFHNNHYIRKKYHES